MCNAYLYTRGAGKKKVEKTIKNNLNSPFLTPMAPIGFHKWPNNGHEIASHSTHYNFLARTHH